MRTIEIPIHKLPEVKELLQTTIKVLEKMQLDLEMKNFLKT